MLTRSFTASDILIATQVGSGPGNPAWLNQHFKPKLARQKTLLGGGGIYAIFVRGALVYLGKYAGVRNAPMGGCALRHRWLAHMDTISMRGAKLSINRKAECAIRDGDAEPLKTLGHAILDREASLWRDQGMQASSAKIIWAAANWSLMSGPIEDVIDQIRIVYVRPTLAAGDLRGTEKVAMSKWLDTVEAPLIQYFCPPPQHWRQFSATCRCCYRTAGRGCD